MGYLKLWKWIRRGAAALHGHADTRNRPPIACQPPAGSSACAELREPRRVREWRDIHSQLHAVVAEHGWRPEHAAGELRADPRHAARRAAERGVRADACAQRRRGMGRRGRRREDWYLGARGIASGATRAHLSKPGRWLVAAELVRRPACTAAAWRRSSRSGSSASPATCCSANCSSRTGKRGCRGRCGQAGHALRHRALQQQARELRPGGPGAREIFIREALVAPMAGRQLPFLAHNRKLVRQIGSWSTSRGARTCSSTTS